MRVKIFPLLITYEFCKLTHNAIITRIAYLNEKVYSGAWNFFANDIFLQHLNRLTHEKM